MEILPLILFAALVAWTNTEWATPIEVTSYVDPTRISKTMFTDSSSGVTYIGYCNSTDGLAYFAQLDHSGLFLTGPNIISETLRCYQIAITGSHDGQHVFFVMEARRSMEIELCSLTNLASCDDVFVFESQDGGQNWLPPKSVGGLPGDPIRRRSFTVLTNWNTQYFWLVYNQYVGVQSNIAAIRYDTKKSAFDTEHLLVERFGEMNFYPLLTYDENKKTSLMLMYTTPYSISFQTMLSTDEGATWTKGHTIPRVCKDTRMAYKTVTSSGNYILTGCGKGSDIYFTFSSDMGKTWSEPDKFINQNVEDVTFCLPENILKPDRNLLVLYSKGKGFDLAFDKIPLSKYKLATIPNQFYYAASKMDINCYYVENELKMRLMYQVRSPYKEGSKYTLYIIDNDNVEGKVDEEHKSDL